MAQNHDTQRIHFNSEKAPEKVSTDNFVLRDVYGRPLKPELSPAEKETKQLFEGDSSVLEVALPPEGPPPERYLAELLSPYRTADGEEERQHRALEYIADLKPLAQLRLLHTFNQPGYSAEIDGEDYDQREKWILAYGFNGVAANVSNALVSLTAETWKRRMSHKGREEEQSKVRSLLDYASGRDLAYRSRIRLPKYWEKYAELTYVAPGVVAARNAKGMIKRVAHIDEVPDNLSERDIGVLHASYGASFLRRAYRDTTKLDVQQCMRMVGKHLQDNDLLYVKQADGPNDFLDRADSLLAKNQRVRLEKDDFEDFDSLDGLEDQESRALLQLAHMSGVRDTLEEATGINLADITLPTQVQLLKYMTSRTKEEFARLSAAADKSRAILGSTASFYETFLATEFGDDYGEILLDLSEATSTREFHEALELIAQVREAGRMIAEKFMSEEPLDMVIAERMPTAFAKRVTEMLALARRDGVGEITESLGAVAEASTIIAQSLTGETFKQVDMTTGFGSFGANDMPATITARPSGKNARLGFTARGLGASGKERLNIRLDYEDGRLSLDIGSGAKQGVNSSDIARKVGTDLARGEQALATYRDSKTVLHGNHVREVFEDIPDIYPEEFAGVVNRFMYRLKVVAPTDSQTAA